MFKKIAITCWVACCQLLCPAQVIPVIQARSQALGALVSVHGIVTNGPELGDIRYLQDETAGIAAYPGNGSMPGFAAAVTSGDSITISGYLTNYNGLLEITPIVSYQVMAKKRPLPAPKTAHLTDWDESLEAQLLRVECLSFAASGAGFTGSGSYAVLDPNGDSTVVYLRSDSPIVGSTIPGKTPWR